MNVRQKILKNKKGQVAIFVALIFQLLFLFFAMIVNVGLLVHHKINLQNSVDLAAYYGAMKQAEMLNAMAHVNYQIRQSWKLLAWRYRVVGSGGAIPGAGPYNYSTGQLDPNLDREGPHPSAGDSYQRPIFCGTYAPLVVYDSSGKQESDKGENLCKDILSGGSHIELMKEPAISAAFIQIATAARNLTLQLIEASKNKCEWSGYFNYSTLATWVIAYNFDQLARRALIAKMAKGLSRTNDDFFDIDGESVKEGVKNTLLNNLTEANRDTVNFEMLNGLRQGGCFGTPASGFDPPAWLSEITIFPAFLYQDNICSTSDIKPQPKLLSPENIPNAINNNFQQTTVTELAPLLGRAPAPYQYTLGYEKNPWCMAYVGVKAKSKPRIPFSPTDFELSARAFAKPFGGRFGPWYFKNWPSGSPKSAGSNENVDEKTDPLFPPRLNDPSEIGDPKAVGRTANYSRFVGDRLGLMSMQPLGQYIKALYSPNMNVVLNDWNHVLFERESGKFMGNADNKINDLMAWGWFTRQRPPVRDLEISAVAPDQFDITYYSIDSNFYENYFKRIRDGKLLKAIEYDFPLRGDVGSRFDGTPENEKFSVRDQIETVKTKIPQVLLDHESKLTHIVRDPFHLLTSWTSKDLLDYTNIPGDKYFGGCQKPVSEISKEKQKPYPGDCILGGRTGYSVKLISSDYLKASDLELGGPNVRGPILNPPDPNW